MKNIEIIKVEALVSNELSVTPAANWNDFFNSFIAQLLGLIGMIKTNALCHPFQKNGHILIGTQI